jgi:hypothetical protein
MVGIIQRIPIREVFQKHGIGRLGVANHRLVWLKGNVDRRDRVLLRVGRSGSERHGNTVGGGPPLPNFQAWNVWFTEFR